MCAKEVIQNILFSLMFLPKWRWHIDIDTILSTVRATTSLRAPQGAGQPGRHNLSPGENHTRSRLAAAAY